MDLAELKTFCNTASELLADYAIFSNMDSFVEFGQFGNANYHFAKDWKKVAFDTDFVSTFGTKTWDEENRVCLVHNNQHYTVIYAATGFTQKP